jgi:hypothetical protein
VSAVWLKKPERQRDARRRDQSEWEHRLEAVEARLKHLEQAHEGLQDAVYRRALLDDGNLDDLRRRTRPEQIARDLSQDARRRGL